MTLPELLHKIDELQARIVAAGPLTPEAKHKLDYRLRLDWNYHSNVMEGSSLTQQETRSIMLGNVTVSGKPIKDVLEMQGHDEVVTKLLGMASGELNLSESRIKEVHRAIVREDEPTKQAQVGQWKTEPNYLHNFKGERIDFLLPEEVPDAMHKLLDRTKADIERIERKAKDAPHPAMLAFAFHRDYVTIHPFHDGNGRTARIFSNLLLMRFGYPPVIIKLEEKETYNRYLAEVQVYGAPPDLFDSFIAERLIRSQALVLDAIEGKDLEELDDIDKKIQLFKKQLTARKGAKVKRSVPVYLELYEQSLRPLFREFLVAMGPFMDMFLSVNYSLSAYQFNKREPTEVRTHLFDELFQQLYNKAGVPPTPEGMHDEWVAVQQLNKLDLTMSFIGFKHDGINAFNVSMNVEVVLEEFTYVVFTHGDRPNGITHLYDEQLEEVERRGLLAHCKEQVYELIQVRMQSAG